MRLFRILMLPIALIYSVVVHVRNYLYDIGIFTSKRFETPTICVGNLSVGGTGKTPMVEYLVRKLSPNHSVAVLSRGYKRKTSGFYLATNNSTVDELGDEPFQIFTKFPFLILAVDANRTEGILRLEKKKTPDVILLDDAFQHRKVIPTYNILLTAYDNLFVCDFYLPFGNLRDAKNQKKRADIIVVTKCPPAMGRLEQEGIRKKLNTDRLVLFSFMTYGQELFSSFGNKDFQFLMDKKVVLVTGIANPKPFIDFMRTKLTEFEHKAYSDHHYFSTAEINEFQKYDVVVTTEKDYVRLNGQIANAYYIEVKHTFLGDGENVLSSEVKSAIKNHSVD